MTGSFSPQASLCGRWLASRLRALREEQGLTLKYVAAAVGVSFSELSGYERAVSPIPRSVLEQMLVWYRVYDTSERNLLLQWADDAGHAHQGGFDHGVQTDSRGDVLWLQSRASVIRCYAVVLVPDLLRTTDYAETVAVQVCGFHASAGVVSQHIQAVVEQQDALSQRSTPPELVFLLDEAVLHRPTGSDRVWGDQLSALAKAAANGQLQVLPAEVRAVAGADVGFTVYATPDRPTPVAQVEYLGGRLLLEDAAAAQQHATAFGRLRALALSAEQSAERISTYLESS
jgi:transcriptional regulator with XRE-family HTH domain